MTAQPPPPGYPPQQPAAQPPDNYLVWSILATVLCFPITGIIAIVKAASVNGLWTQGRYAEAQDAAASAKKWVRWSVIIWVVLVVIYVVIIVIVMVTAHPDNPAPAAMLMGTF
ncbi:MAG TPA: CD225/dispanin family protein [Mycobacterium sp.]